MPLPSDPTGPERPRERASWLAWLRQLVPVAVPLVLFVQIVAWGIAPALEEQAILEGKAQKVLVQYRASVGEYEQSRREEEFLSDPVGRERLLRRIEEENGARPAREILRELSTASSRPAAPLAGSRTTPTKKAR